MFILSGDLDIFIIDLLLCVKLDKQKIFSTVYFGPMEAPRKDDAEAGQSPGETLSQLCGFVAFIG
jgi:hypothetical protein